MPGEAVTGGLGTYDDIGLRGASQFIAAVVTWTLADDLTFRVSLGYGVNKASVPRVLRFSVPCEMDGLGHKVRNLFSD